MVDMTSRVGNGIKNYDDAVQQFIKCTKGMGWERDTARCPFYDDDSLGFELAWCDTKVGEYCIELTQVVDIDTGAIYYKVVCAWYDDTPDYELVIKSPLCALYTLCRLIYTFGGKFTVHSHNTDFYEWLDYVGKIAREDVD